MCLSGSRASHQMANDVLLEIKRSLASSLRALWSGDHLEGAVIGVGINVFGWVGTTAGSVLSFRRPVSKSNLATASTGSTCCEHGLRDHRLAPKMNSDEFIEAWKDASHSRGNQVTLTCEDQPPLTGRLLGLENDGSLRLTGIEGVIRVQAGEIHLRPADDRMH